MIQIRSMARLLLMAGLSLGMAGSVYAQKPGLHDNQTVLRASIPRGSFSIFINNVKVGDYQGKSATTLDIGNYVRRGTNQLRIAWRPLSNRVPIGQFTIAFAAKRSLFQELTQVTINDTKVGSKTLVFTVPGKRVPPDSIPKPAVTHTSSTAPVLRIAVRNGADRPTP